MCCSSVPYACRMVSKISECSSARPARLYSLFSELVHQRCLCCMGVMPRRCALLEQLTLSKIFACKLFLGPFVVRQNPEQMQHECPHGCWHPLAYSDFHELPSRHAVNLLQAQSYPNGGGLLSLKHKTFASACFSPTLGPSLL